MNDSAESASQQSGQQRSWKCPIELFFVGAPSKVDNLGRVVLMTSKRKLASLLDLEEPWVVEAVNLDLAAQRVEIRLRAQVDTGGLKCPECGKWAAL